MNPLQRRSLFAILSLAESAIQQAKSILAHDAPQPHGLPGDLTERVDPSPQPGTPEYLSESEEEEFEKMLEADRQRLMQEEERRLKALWGSDE